MKHSLVAVDDSIKLVQLLPDRAEELFTIVDANRQHLGRWLDWVTSTKSAEDSRQRIEQTIMKRQSGTTYTYAILVEDKIAGDISLMYLNKPRPVEISYWMSQDYASQGIMAKAVRALTSYAFRELDIEFIIIRAQTRNIASNKVALKSAYQLAGQELGEGKVVNTYIAYRL